MTTISLQPSTAKIGAKVSTLHQFEKLVVSTRMKITSAGYCFPFQYWSSVERKNQNYTSHRTQVISSKLPRIKIQWKFDVMRITTTCKNSWFFVFCFFLGFQAWLELFSTNGSDRICTVPINWNIIGTCICTS
jgi:hypothetical protein